MYIELNCIFLLQALLNPMQALLNALVYRKWNVFKPKFSVSLPKFSTKELSHNDEQSPLLGSEPPRLQLTRIPPSINNYSTL